MPIKLGRGTMKERIPGALADALANDLIVFIFMGQIDWHIAISQRMRGHCYLLWSRFLGTAARTRAALRAAASGAR